MEPVEMIGRKEVRKHRGYTIIKSPAGTYGFNAWCCRRGDEKEGKYWCPYIHEDGATKAIDCILDYLTSQGVIF